MKRWGKVAAAAVAAVALAACQPADPLAQARRTCADARAEAEARMEACTSAIESGSLDAAERADAQANRGDASYEAGDVTAALRDYTASLDVTPNGAQALKRPRGHPDRERLCSTPPPNRWCATCCRMAASRRRPIISLA
ncbi:MAG: hypothetical protein R3C16_09135 [Hyphomonadaceae bacterium]